MILKYKLFEYDEKKIYLIEFFKNEKYVEVEINGKGY